MNKKIKKSNASKNKQKSSIGLRQLLPIAVGLIGLATVFNSLLISHLLKTTEYQSNAQVGSILIRAMESLLKPLPTDVHSGMAYISQADVMLPAASSELGGVMYSYYEAVDKSPAVLHIASETDVYNASTRLHDTNRSTEDFFSDVPKIQACSRGVTISFDQSYTDQEPTHTKKLQDGRTAYFYEEADCKNQDLLDYVKNLQSY